MWLSAIKLAVNTGAAIYKNKQDSKRLKSEAERLHFERMAKGEVEYQTKVIESNDKGWKDEFVLLLISAPVVLLIWSVFSDDPEIKTKIDLFFDYFNSLPLFYQALFVGVVSAIYGLKGADILKRK